MSVLISNLSYSNSIQEKLTKRSLKINGKVAVPNAAYKFHNNNIDTF